MANKINRHYKCRCFSQNERDKTGISESSYDNFSGFRFKKINSCFVALLVFALCFFVSCGGDSVKPVESHGTSVSNFGKLGQECYPNETCDEGLICDTDKNVCVEDPDNTDKTPDSDDSDSSDSQPDSDADTGSTETPEEGIYLGIIGFNDDLTIMPIKRLTDANKEEFKSFISYLLQLNYTALYWADYSALEMMRDYNPVPEKLKKVAMVTFTDGLDNQSLASDDFNPGFNSQAEYANAIHSMIMDEEGIHGLPVTAYSIGLTGKDVSDVEKFTETLEKLATEEEGDEKFVFQVSDMNEVGQHFADIAASLYKVSTTINVGVYIPGGYDDGQVIRYTFDNVSAAADSALYIEAKYRRSGTSRTLENIKYKGFITGASTISSSATGPHNELYFQFNDLKYSNGDPVSQSEIISKSRLWKQTSSGAWDGETEMNMAELPPIIDEDKSSALIMLVLDSTTSLGSDFSRMQNEASNFVEILVNGENNSGGCEPGKKQKCEYDAPAETENVGICKAAIRTCDENGKWGKCEGEVLPKTEICGNGIDENCDGVDATPEIDQNCNTGSSLPECSKSSGTPCYDSTSHLTWSKISSNYMIHTAATTFCQGSEMNGYGGFTDWRLPNIDELKTLIINPSGTPRTKNCAVSEATGHLSFSSDWTCSTCTEACTQESSGTDCASCNYSSEGIYSKLGDGNVSLWSSSVPSDYSNDAWTVNFYNGDVRNSGTFAILDVRCVR